MESFDQNDLRKFKKHVNDYKNVSEKILKQREVELLSKLSTGYSYAITINDNNVIADSTVLAGIKKKIKNQEILNEAKIIIDPLMPKFFTFSSENYSKLTYEDDCFENNEFVK